MFGCKPISAFWEQVEVVKVLGGYEYHCFDEGIDVFTAAVVSAAQDLLAAVLPTFLYWNLRIPIRQKIALFGIFAIGYGAVAIGALRAYYSWRIFFVTYDVTWETWKAWEMTLIELHVGAMCANAPALKVFCMEYLRLDRLTYGSKSSSKGSRSQGSSKGPSASSRTGTILVALCRGQSAKASRRDGYLSEPHTDVLVDVHGGVERRGDLHYSKSGVFTRNPTDFINDDHDIEMGGYAASSHGDSRHASSVEMEGLQALPPVPFQALPLNPTPRMPPLAVKHISGSFSFGSKIPRSA